MVGGGVFEVARVWRAGLGSFDAPTAVRTGNGQGTPLHKGPLSTGVLHDEARTATAQAADASSGPSPRQHLLTVRWSAKASTQTRAR